MKQIIFYILFYIYKIWKIIFYIDKKFFDKIANPIRQHSFSEFQLIRQHSFSDFQLMLQHSLQWVSLNSTAQLQWVSVDSTTQLIVSLT